jgi:hypothetical protein
MALQVVYSYSIVPPCPPEEGEVMYRRTLNDALLWLNFSATDVRVSAIILMDDTALMPSCLSVPHSDLGRGAPTHMHWRRLHQRYCVDDDICAELAWYPQDCNFQRCGGDRPFIQQ